MRHGLRSPETHVWGRAPGVVAYGLSAGMAYGEPRSERVDVDAQDLAQGTGQVAARAQRIAAATAVAGGDVQVAVRAEGETAAVVIAEAIGHVQDAYLAGRVGGRVVRPRGSNELTTWSPSRAV